MRSSYSSDVRNKLHKYLICFSFTTGHLCSLGFSTVSPCFSLLYQFVFRFYALCIIFCLYFIRILRVTVCECHIEIKGYTYLLAYILQESLLFSTLTFGSVFSDCVVFWRYELCIGPVDKLRVLHCLNCVQDPGFCHQMRLKILSSTTATLCKCCNLLRPVIPPQINLSLT